MKRIRFLALGLTVLMVLLTACAGQQATPAAGSSDQPAAATTPPEAGQAQQSAQPAASAPAPSGGPALPGNTVFLNMGATNQTSSHFALAVALGRSVEKGTDAKLKVSVVETGASVDNLRRLKRGDLDLGLSSGDAALKAYTGMEPFTDIGPNQDLRTLWVHLVYPNVIVVRADSGVEKLEDLNGKPFTAGFRGSATEALIKNIMEVLDIHPEYVAGDLAEAVAATKDRRIVGFGKSAGGLTVPDSSVQELSALVDVRVLGFTPEQAKLLAEKVPAFLAVEIPAGVYENQTAPLLTSGASSQYVTTSKLDPAAVYHMYRSVVENQALQVEAFPGVEGNNYLEMTAKYAMMPLHSGVVRYLQDQGMQVPAALIPPEHK